ncbi:MAG: glutamate--cysteine ligase [Polyangiaceae bacterium]|nr:glutamate--cysteine ligase [Polyangiaceae bacterium]MCB9606403.1 glutamate--cysteine ligase [Polyangiaceae bacterium]
MATAELGDPAQAPIQSFDDLLQIFHESQQPVERWLIGAEAEKFGVDARTGEPISYDGERGVLRVLDALATEFDYTAGRESADGPIISLTRGSASVTLEPGAQLELSGSPLADVHAVCAEVRGHLSELARISADMNLVWLGLGFHPFARQADLPWVPKQRYAIMREYLPTRGRRGVDMMRRTATVQANFDYSDEQDAMRKLGVSLRIGPIVNALFANSPFFEGKLAGKVSERGAVWLEMDPERSGMILDLAKKPRATYADYAEWALDAGMFFFKRNGQIVPNTGQTFRSFMRDGFQGERATLGDWQFHLNTLFPDARLKRTLEVRTCDSLPTRFVTGVPALFTGLLYDEQALAEAEDLSFSFDLEALMHARVDLVTHGIRAEVGGRPVRALAEQLVEIARGGLSRRHKLDDQGRDETIHLQPISELLERGLMPADLLTEGLSSATPAELMAAVLERGRV